MKNRFKINIIIFLFFTSSIFAEELNFEVKKLEILNKESKILATEGKVTTLDNDLEFYADNFEYDKNLEILVASKNSYLIINSKNILINFERAIYDQRKKILKASENVSIKDRNNKFEIQTSFIEFHKDINLIKSNKKTKLINFNNDVYSAENVSYEIDNNIIKLKNLTSISSNEIIRLTSAFIDTQTKKIFGKDPQLEIIDNDSKNDNREPRLLGASIIIDDNNSKISKGVFTNCKKRNKGCTPWKITADEINHDKKDQIINYKDAVFHIYDLPVMYFPRFFHPGPEVKKKSGFLVPNVSNSSLSGTSVKIPYYYVISDSKDLTFSPRLYGADKFLFQTEFRKAHKNSFLISDFSVFKDDDKNSKNHFFGEYQKNFFNNVFNENDLKIKIQQVSNDTYLKVDKIKSDIVNNDSSLENSISLRLAKNNMEINSKMIIYENLNVGNQSDKYEYVLPSIELIKNFDNNLGLNGDFNLNSNLSIRQFNTNITEKININDFNFQSNPIIPMNGFFNNYKFLIKNVNSDSQNSTNYKNDKFNSEIFGIFQYNSTLPLIKENESFQKILTPKLSLNIAPDHTKDIRNNFSRVNIENIYSLNRISSSQAVEGGASIIVGNEYSLINKNNSEEIFGIEIANNLRFEDNEDLPRNNQLNQKTSNFFGKINYKPNKILELDYDFSKKNNFDDISYEKISAIYNYEKFVTTISLINENDTSTNNNFLETKIDYGFDDRNYLSYSTRKNKKTNLVEYYNLAYQYKNDCLAASIEYNKSYYDDREIKPEENIFFKLSIIPFGQIGSTPDLMN